MDDDRTVIPFGKHKGKTVEEVEILDRPYLEWLTGQSWFRDRYVVLHQTIINHGAEPEDTPDHNALQALFLDDAYCLKFVAALGIDAEKHFHERQRELIRDMEASLQKAKDKLTTWLTRHSSGHSPAGWEALHTAEQEQAIAATTQQLVLERTKPYRPNIPRRGFEVRGIDVVFQVDYAGEFRIEIKPTVGDDYPAVLRQMKRTMSDEYQPTKVLFLERYTGVGATRAQFEAIFKAAGIAVVFRDQVR